jgi:hypothetical protein
MTTEGAVADSEAGRIPHAIDVDGVTLATWPEAQNIEVMVDSRIAITHFADAERYHAPLLAAVLAARDDARFRDAKPNTLPWACGFKVRNLAAWDVPAVSLVHARALAFAHRVMARGPVYADDTWASIYGTGDYCLPHSHMRCDVSVVYMADEGDIDREDEVAGKFMFMDPRLPPCCPHEPGRATRPIFPPMRPGTMIAFAGECIHSVTPYRGARPRITMSWNMTRTRLPEETRLRPAE